MEHFKRDVVAFIEAESKGWMEAADRAQGDTSNVLRGKACAVLDAAKQVAATPVDERAALLLKRAEEYRVAHTAVGEAEAKATNYWDPCCKEARRALEYAEGNLQAAARGLE